VRLWCLHPRYLDAKGLVALWREGLLARAVLNEQTQGYKHHPQLERFRRCLQPIAAIDCYLRAVYEESVKRGYHFDAGKLGPKVNCPKLLVTQGQLRYELEHLKVKLKIRAQTQYQKISAVQEPQPHPLFKVRAGGIEPWERLGGR
jgi:hypothetical protein